MLSKKAIIFLSILILVLVMLGAIAICKRADDLIAYIIRILP